MTTDAIEVRANEAIRHALDGTAMLFVGSGVGFLARTADGTSLPNGRALADLLHEEVGMEVGRHNLQRISQYALKKIGADRLISLLKSKLNSVEIDNRLQEVYRMPWQRIYTTNYDDVIEKSRQNYAVVSPFTLSDDPMRAPKGAIVHLNGYIDRIKPDTFDRDAVLTDVSYSINEFQGSEWAKQFLVDIRTSRSIIFIGYSMADLDIVRLILSDPEVAHRTLIYVSPDTDEVDLETLSAYGTVNTGGFDDFYSRLIKISSSYMPVENAVFTELRQVKAQETAIDALTSVDTVYRQLVYGKVAERQFLLSEQPLADVSYIGPRVQIGEALDVIERGAARDLFIHGEIASGKSCACLLAARHFLNRGYDVYIATHGPHLASDLERLAAQEGFVCIIFDGYGAFIDEAKIYAARRRPTHRMILSERTVTHELIAGVIERTSGFGPAVDCYLGKMEEPDLKNLSDLINYAGLWGARAGLSPAGKSSVIRNDLKSSLYLVLLEVIKSEKVQYEIKRLLTPITYDRKAMLVFISVFIVSSLGFRFEINDWQVFFKIDSIRRIMRVYQEQFSNFMSVSGLELTPRSGLLSSHILQNFASDTDIVDCLYAIYKAAAESEQYDPYLADLRIELMRYRAIEPMLSEDNKYARVVDYYNKIRSVSGTVDNAD